MNFKEIQRLVKLLEKSTIQEIEIVDKGERIRLVKQRPKPQNLNQPEPKELPEQTIKQTATGSEGKIHEIKALVAGTFYAAPAPDAEPYVQQGDMVTKGQTVCIVEAMKLMNEIITEVNGKIVEVLVENKTLVEQNQVLFRVFTS